MNPPTTSCPQLHDLPVRRTRPTRRGPVVETLSVAVAGLWGPGSVGYHIPQLNAGHR